MTRRALVPWVLAGVVAAGALVLRAELMTVHEAGRRTGSTEVEVGARTTGSPALLEPRTQALVTTCRLHIGTDHGDSGLREVEPSVYAFTVEPALDDFDERELRGCLQDLRVEHLLLHVRQVRHQGAPD